MLTEGSQAQEPHGECILGTGRSSKLASVHDLKLELLKLNAKKLTITLDCCRTVMRDATVTDLKYVKLFYL